jgi:LPS export ABC transporter protein LptC
MRVAQSRLDQAVWVLEADEAIHDPERDVTDLVELTVTFYDREGTVSSVLTAETGEADAKTRHLVARTNVVVETPEGYRLETETLRWDNERERILSDDPVRIRQGRNLYTGVGLVSDPELIEFEILNEFRATVIPDEVPGDAPVGTSDESPTVEAAP